MKNKKIQVQFAADSAVYAKLKSIAKKKGIKIYCAINEALDLWIKGGKK